MSRSAGSTVERPGPARRAATVLRWPAGIGLMSWRYLWSVTALHRSEVDDELDEGDLPPPLPEAFVDERSKRLDDGVGPLFHRRFSVRIVDSPMTAEQLMTTITADINRAVPNAVAVFRKTAGADRTTRPGDEYLVRMPGPWDGPVRAVHRDATSFRLATLAGHLEAGQIEFRALGEDRVAGFEIEAWSRAGDRLSHLLYDRLRLAKEIQLSMWVHFCLRSAELSGGRARGGVTVATRRLAQPPFA